MNANTLRHLASELAYAAVASAMENGDTDPHSAACERLDDWTAIRDIAGAPQAIERMSAHDQKNVAKMAIAIIAAQ